MNASRWWFRGLIGAAFIAVAVACGGKVVYVEGGAGGEGGESNLSPDDACAKLCAAAPQCIGDPCLSNCALSIIPGCEAESAALVACLAEELPADCIPTQTTCISEVFALGQCGLDEPPAPG